MAAISIWVPTVGLAKPADPILAIVLLREIMLPGRCSLVSHRIRMDCDPAVTTEEGAIPEYYLDFSSEFSHSYPVFVSIKWNNDLVFVLE